MNRLKMINYIQKRNHCESINQLQKASLFEFKNLKLSKNKCRSVYHGIQKTFV